MSLRSSNTPPIDRHGPGRHRPGLAVRSAPVAALACFLALAPSFAPGQAPTGGVADETRRDFHADCLASGCHDGIRRSPWVHAPVSVGACETCHAPVGKPEEHRFVARKEKEGRCGFCHAPKPGGGAHASAHDFSEDTDCTICHDPHGGANATLLRAGDPGKLCGECHPREGSPSPAPGAGAPAAPAARKPIREFPHPHGPFAAGLCLDCHTAHTASQPKLLRKSEQELCTGCHAETVSALASLAHVHEPVLAECRACHHAHGGESAGMLRARTAELCLGCHEPVRAEMGTPGKHVHGAMTEGDSCIACHLGHGGATEALLREPISAGCLGCHAEEIVAANGRKVAGMARELAERPVHHQPVREGKCLDCHRPHVSEHPDLLAKAAPDRLYVPYSDEAYALCYGCHEPLAITEERGTRTKFRDGDRNLHAVHVNREKGRSCAICHEVHASRSPALLREDVPFGPGGWRLPIEFRATADGGTCLSGCHAEKSYDRRKTPGDGAVPVPSGAAPEPGEKERRP